MEHEYFIPVKPGCWIPLVVTLPAIVGSANHDTWP